MSYIALTRDLSMVEELFEGGQVPRVLWPPDEAAKELNVIYCIDSWLEYGWGTIWRKAGAGSALTTRRSSKRVECHLLHWLVTWVWWRNYLKEGRCRECSDHQTKQQKSWMSFIALTRDLSMVEELFEGGQVPRVLWPPDEAAKELNVIYCIDSWLEYGRGTIWRRAGAASALTTRRSSKRVECHLLHWLVTWVW